MFSVFAPRSFPSQTRRLWLILGLCLAAASGASAQDTPAAPLLGAPAVQRLSFAEGPNWVSLRVYPEDRSFEAIFGSRLSRVLTAKNAAGASYAPQHGARGLPEWPWDQAVFIYARQPFVLDVAGREILEDSQIPLDTGWHRIPYLLTDSRPPSEALASILPALLEVRDGHGRTYPATVGSAPLEAMEPGSGYRVRLSSPAELVYATQSQSPPAADRTVATLAEAVALEGLTPGQRIAVTDPVRGGTFVVRDSGAPSDGGTVFVPTAFTEAATATGLDNSQTLFDGSNDDGIVFDSFRLMYGPDEDDALDATALHGHASGKGNDAGEPLLNTQNGRLLIPNSLRDLAKSLTGSSKLKASYRYATSARRLERVVEPIVLEGQSTTDYVRPEWWGAVPYPADWTPNTSAPSGPRARPAGIASGDPVYDATDRLASAINAAEVGAATTSRQHYVVLAGMYGYARVIEMQDQVVLKGEQDGVRDGQGLRVLKGAPWHFWAVRNPTKAAYQIEKSPRDLIMVNTDPLVVLRHGRQSQLNRVVDVELDGNLKENEYVFSGTYLSASGGASRSWTNQVENMLQNTGHWNGFVASHQHADTEIGSNARLENVHVHNYGGNLVLGGEPIHFGGSRDLRLGNSRRNHFMYRVFTDEGTTIDRIEMYGYAWAGYVPFQQGHYRNVVFRDLARNPQFGLGNRSPETLIGHRNDGVPADDLFNEGNPGYYFGDDAVIEGLRFELSSNFRPRSSLVTYDSGPLSLLGVVLDVEGGNPVSLVSGGSDDLLQRSGFVLEDVVVEQGQIRSFLASAALRASAKGVGTFSGDGNGQGLILRPFREGHTATFYNVGGGVSGAGIRTPEVVQIRLREDSEATLDVFVRQASFTGVTYPVMATYGDPSDSDVSDRYRVFWRDVTLDRWRDSNNDRGKSRKSGELQYFERVTARGRTSEGAGTLSSATLRRASNGTRYVDVDPSMFYAPQESSYVVVTGRDAGRFLGWENVGDKYDPVLRLSFSGTSPVSVDWTAAIRPIPDGVAFPE